MSVETLPSSPRADSRRGGIGSRIVRGAGWTLITAGVLVALFVVYELFVTDLITARHQATLRDDLARQFRSTDPEGQPRPIAGRGLAILRIPRIELDAVVVEGVGLEDLKKGPGHYPTTPLPGERGNVGIAGHRTTYGKPFWSLDELRVGDEIFLRTSEGEFVYEVRWKRVVLPSQAEVLDPTGRPGLTLTTCEPKFSAARRLIVRALQVRAPPDAEAA
ncbi:MAG TPA: class E sortase [Actinomycetota bacterium]|nr:class E sortase [Actinomycetota bacterium]